MFENVNAACADVTAIPAPATIDYCGAGPYNLAFTNASTGVDAGAVDYDWFINGTLFDQVTGTGAPINQSITAIGTYDIMLVAINAADGCRDTGVVTVTIHPIPDADFTFTPNNDCAGQPVVFTNTSTGIGTNATYWWDFDDGFTSTASDPSHTYTAGGTYTVTNVGNFGSIMGTPIINQPQVGILALGSIRKVPAVIETPDGDFIGIRMKMYLSHSYDHRVIDGALGGMFAKAVADYLEAWDVNRDF